VQFREFPANLWQTIAEDERRERRWRRHLETFFP